jgi:hypothetical protein
MATTSYLRRILATTSLALSLAACATPQVWTARQGPTDMDGFRRDSYRCVQESRTSWGGGGSGAVGLGLMIGAQVQAQKQADGLFRLCMEAAGYRRLSEAEVDQAKAEGRVAR